MAFSSFFKPYKISIDFKQLNNFDYIGFSPGLEINNVSFDESVEKKYCTINICNFDERKIISKEKVKFVLEMKAGDVKANVGDNLICSSN